MLTASTCCFQSIKFWSSSLAERYGLKLTGVGDAVGATVVVSKRGLPTFMVLCDEVSAIEQKIALDTIIEENCREREFRETVISFLDQ